MKIDCYEKKRFWATMIGAVLSAILAHSFGIVNVIKNWDNAHLLRGSGAGLTSGRWALSLMDQFLSKCWGGVWNLQFYNGILTIVFLALSSYIVVKIFDVKDLMFCALWGHFSSHFRQRPVFCFMFLQRRCMRLPCCLRCLLPT